MTNRDLNQVDLWDKQSFRNYAEFCASRGYCRPWHPFVGGKYGATNLVKFAYCGGSAWWESDGSTELTLDRSRQLTNDFVSQGMYSTPFWRLFSRLSALVFGQQRTDFVASDCSAWTNLSKTGRVGESAPPDDDLELRHLDVQQLRRELSLLEPDILVCVSGSLVPSTGHAVFNDWPSIEGLEPKTVSTWIRRTPWGGFLIWTMHPAYKSESWIVSVENDVRAIIAALNQSKLPNSDGARKKI